MHTFQKKAYLTIDDGPSLHRPILLEALAKKGIQAIFFSEGRLLEQAYTLGINTLRAGHHLGNHSWTHPHFSDINLDQAKAEILRTDAMIEALYQEAGITRPAKWFRFPYGDKGDGRRGFVFKPWLVKNTQRHKQIQSYLAELGYAQPNWHQNLPKWYEKSGLASDLDCHWTFDVMEWALNQTPAPYGLTDVQLVKARVNTERPRDLRGSLWWQARWDW